MSRFWTESEDFDELSELVFPSHALEPGQMIIWSHALCDLKDHVTYLKERAKFYGEFPKDASSWQETLAHFEARIEQIMKTNQGEA